MRRGIFLYNHRPRQDTALIKNAIMNTANTFRYRLGYDDERQFTKKTFPYKSYFNRYRLSDSWVGVVGGCRSYIAHNTFPACQCRLLCKQFGEDAHLSFEQGGMSLKAKLTITIPVGILLTVLFFIFESPVVKIIIFALFVAKVITFILIPTIEE